MAPRKKSSINPPTPTPEEFKPRKIVEYTIVVETLPNTDNLDDCVNDLCADGWVPHGSISQCYDPQLEEISIVQPMIRITYSKEKK